MYEPGTELTLKTQRAPDEETNEEFPYNKVRVVGPSPIDHGVHSEEWVGAAGAGVILTPIANFGSTIDEPLGKVQALYDVTFVPETVVDVAPQVKIIHSTSQSAGPTPEEVFSEKAPGPPPEEGQIRRRTAPHRESPLDDPRPKASDGPLGPTPAESLPEAPPAPVAASPLDPVPVTQPDETTVVAPPEE